MGCGAMQGGRSTGQEQHAREDEIARGNLPEPIAGVGPQVATRPEREAELYENPYSENDTDEDVDIVDEEFPLNGVEAAGNHLEAPLGASGAAIGAIWHTQIVSDHFNDPKHCTEAGKLKPKRPLPHITLSDIIQGLACEDGRWYYHGVLNEWPALRNLQLCSLTTKVRNKLVPAAAIRRLWAAGSATDPIAVLRQFKSAPMPKSLRATMRGPPWSSSGWTPDAPGFVLWYALRYPEEARLFCGEDIVSVSRQFSETKNALAVQAHVIAHRYSVEKESLRDRLTWHTAVAMEWSHGQGMTLIECAWRNGLGGYGGKSNWCHDKLSNPPKIYAAMNDNMKAPWDTHHAEVRFIDMAVKTRDELQEYLDLYGDKGKTSGALLAEEQRFHEPRIVSSDLVRLSHRSHADIARYVLNYMARRGHYDEKTANCQTFAADLYGFVIGKKDVKPFSEFLRVQYKSRPYLFLYNNS